MELQAVKALSIEAGKIFLRDRGFAVVKISSIVNTIKNLQNIVSNKNQSSLLASKFEVESKVFEKYHTIFSALRQFQWV